MDCLGLRDLPGSALGQQGSPHTPAPSLDGEQETENLGGPGCPGISLHSRPCVPERCVAMIWGEAGGNLADSCESCQKAVQIVDKQARRVCQRVTLSAKACMTPA